MTDSSWSEFKDNVQLTQFRTSDTGIKENSKNIFVFIKIQSLSFSYFFHNGLYLFKSSQTIGLVRTFFDDVSKHTSVTSLFILQGLLLDF